MIFEYWNEILILELNILKLKIYKYADITIGHERIWLYAIVVLLQQIIPLWMAQ